MSATPTPPAVHPPAALPPGTRLGEFELRHVLGVGGFAIVYLAFDHQLEREVALKEYMPTMLAGRTESLQVSLRSQNDAETFALGLKSFVNEARLLARFDLPSLVRVHRFWEENGTAYMAMPVVRGQSAKAWRQARTTPPDEAWLRALLEPMLDTLEKLHAEAVYHRDIAPDNIQIDDNGRPVLLDLGAARRVIGDATQTLTAILKPAYAPIEQYAEVGALRQGAWTDLYALGATLHYLLLGRPPLPATARALHDELPPLAGQTLPGVSLRFLQIVDWLLSPRPQDRPQSVAMLREALQGSMAPPVRAVARPPPPVQWAPTPQTGGAAADPADDTTVVTGASAAQRAATADSDSAATVLHTAPAVAAVPGAGAGTDQAEAAPHPSPAARPAPEPEPQRPALAGSTSAAAALAPPLPVRSPASPDTARPSQPQPSRIPLVAGVAALLVVAAAAGAWFGGGRAAVDSAGAQAAAQPASLAAPAAGAGASAAAAVAMLGTDTSAQAKGDGAPALATELRAPATSPAPAWPQPLPGPAPAVVAVAVAPAAATAAKPVEAKAGGDSPRNPARTAAPAPTERRALAQQRPPAPAEPSAGLAAELSKPGAVPTPSLPAEPAPSLPMVKPEPPATAPPVVAAAPLPAPLQGPTERCGRRVLLALWNCIDRQCREPELRSHPECVKLSEDRERSLRGRL